MLRAPTPGPPLPLAHCSRHWCIPLAGLGVATVRVFVRMLLFYPAGPSLRMEHVLSPLAARSPSSAFPLRAPATEAQLPWERFPLPWANGSPFFFRNRLWQQHGGILSFTRLENSGGAQGQRGVPAARVETLLPSSQ